MKKKDSLGLYFVAIIPEEPVLSEVFRLMEEVSQKFNSKGRLKLIRRPLLPK